MATGTDLTLCCVGTGGIGARRTWREVSHSQRTEVPGRTGASREPLHGGGRDSPSSAGNSGKTWAKHKHLSRGALLGGMPLWAVGGLQAQVQDPPRALAPFFHLMASCPPAWPPRWSVRPCSGAGWEEAEMRSAASSLGTDVPPMALAAKQSSPSALHPVWPDPRLSARGLWASRGGLSQAGRDCPCSLAGARPWSGASSSLCGHCSLSI